MWLADLQKHFSLRSRDVHAASESERESETSRRPTGARSQLPESSGLRARDDVRRRFENDRQIGAGQEPREGARDGRGNVQTVTARVDSDVEKPALDHHQP